MTTNPTEALDAVEQALRNIVYTVSEMQKQCEAEGSILNGGVANQLANDANYLRSLAKPALLTHLTTLRQQVASLAQVVQKVGPAEDCDFIESGDDPYCGCMPAKEALELRACYNSLTPEVLALCEALAGGAA